MAIVGNTALDQYQLQQLEGNLVLGPEMSAAVAANPHLMAPLLQALRDAVAWSFDHPATRMRCISGSEIQRRGDICLHILEQAYAEQGYHINQLKDALPAMLVDVLMMDKDGNDLLEAEHQQGRWTADGDARPDVELTDDEEAELGGDLTEGVEPDPFPDEVFAQVNKE